MARAELREMSRQFLEGFLCKKERVSMKPLLKGLADGVAMVLVFPAFLIYTLGRATLGAEKAFPGWSQLLGLMPGITGVYLRRAFYRLVFPQCGAGSWIGFGTVF